MLPPVQGTVCNEGQPLMAPSASMPSAVQPALHEAECPRPNDPRSVESCGPK